MTLRPALPRSQRQAIGVFACTALPSTFTGIVTDAVVVGVLSYLLPTEALRRPELFEWFIVAGA